MARAPLPRACTERRSAVNGTILFCRAVTRRHRNEIDSSLPVGQLGQFMRGGGSAAMTDTVNIYDAKTNLSKLVDRAAAGEEIIIAKAGRPKAKLVPYQPARKKRRFGRNLLGITYIADDFDGPLPPELQKYFE
jgi:prevent-host-death family protein